MAESTPRRPRSGRVGAVAVALFRTTLWSHAALVIAQPISAGAMLQASVGARSVHAGVGGVMLLVAMAQIPLAVLARFPGRWPLWPAALSVVLLVAETTQTAIGRSGALAVHLPLGVAIVVVVVALAVWSLRNRARRGRGRAAAHHDHQDQMIMVGLHSTRGRPAPSQPAPSQPAPSRSSPSRSSTSRPDRGDRPSPSQPDRGDPCTWT